MASRKHAMTREIALTVIQAALDGWQKSLPFREWSRQDILNHFRGNSVWFEPYALYFEDWAIVVKDRRSSVGAQVSYSEALTGVLS